MRNDTNLIVCLTLTKGQLATLFGISAPTLDKRLPALERDEGFPRRIPGTNTWSRPAVESWFATFGLPASIEPVRVAEIDQARHALEQRYAEAV